MAGEPADDGFDDGFDGAVDEAVGVGSALSSDPPQATSVVSSTSPVIPRPITHRTLPSEPTAQLTLAGRCQVARANITLGSTDRTAPTAAHSEIIATAGVSMSTENGSSAGNRKSSATHRR